jgi:hypothetical protein
MMLAGRNRSVLFALETGSTAAIVCRAALSLISLSIFMSCQTRSDEIKQADSTPVQQSAIDTIARTEIHEEKASISLVWLLDFDNKRKKRNTRSGKLHPTVDHVITALNASYPGILLEKISLGHDTLYTEIKDSRYLCEGMGTSGAGFYIADAVLNLTSADSVRFVKIDFEEGSHASPGIWRKEDFDEYKEIK